MLKISPANESHLHWMFQLLVQAATRGHFEIRNTMVGREVIKRNIHSIVLNKEIVDLGLPAEAIVFENNFGKVGYAVISDTRPGLDGKEVYIFVVDKNYRGNGYGQYMLEEIINRWFPVSDIYARCLPPSRVMATMLMKNGFFSKGKNSDGAEIYRLDKMQPGKCALGL